MKEIVFIYGDDCSKCHQIRPHVEKWASNNGYNFQAVKYAGSWLEITSIPTMQVIEDGGEQILNFEWIIDFITKK